jgi:diguanylate cyclase (GGDEF)-like protein
MWSKLHTTAVAIGAIMLAAIVVSWVSYHAIRSAFVRYQQVSESVRSSRDILYDIVNQENTLLGYLTTRDPFFLKNYTEGVHKTNDDIDKLAHDTHVLDLVLVDTSIERLRDFHKEWQKTSAAELKGGLSSAQAIRLRSYERELLDNMRLNVELVLEGEQARRSVVVRDAGRAIVVGAAILLAAIALLGGMGLFAERVRTREHGRAAQEREKELTRVSALAFYDQLTGLQSRTSFMMSFDQALDRARRLSQPVACLFVDLDGFKAVNDTFGHEAGDRVLKSVAATLRSSVRKSDVVGRMGGDEFALALSILRKPDDAALVAEKILRAVDREIDVGGPAAAHVSSSVGVSFFPDDGQEAETLLRRADGAMYVAKKGGKNRFALWVEERAPA